MLQEYAIARPPLARERIAMHRSTQVALFLALALAAVAYRVAFIVARRLAIA